MNDPTNLDVSFRDIGADGGFMLCITQHHDHYCETFVDDATLRDPVRLREAIDKIVEGFTASDGVGVGRISTA